MGHDPLETYGFWEDNSHLWDYTSRFSLYWESYSLISGIQGGESGHPVTLYSYPRGKLLIIRRKHRDKFSDCGRLGSPAAVENSNWAHKGAFSKRDCL